MPSTPDKSLPRPRFRAGFTAPFLGLRELFRRGSLLWTALPEIGIGTILLLLVLALWVTQFPVVLNLVWKHPEGTDFYGNLQGAKWWVLSPVVVLGAAVLGMLVLTVVGSLFASPFLARLSVKTEALIGPDPSLSNDAAVASWRQGMLAEAKRFVAFVATLLLGGLVHWIPVIGDVIYLAFFVFLCSLYPALVYFDHPFRARGLKFSSKLAFLWRHHVNLLGFGAGVLLLALIPLANLATLPAAVVGATGLHRRLRTWEESR